VLVLKIERAIGHLERKRERGGLGLDRERAGRIGKFSGVLE
jgi:hypothetical protein